jgi:hypothetical protein
MAGARTNKRQNEKEKVETADEVMNRRIAESATPPARAAMGSGQMLYNPSGRPMASTGESAKPVYKIQSTPPARAAMGSGQMLYDPSGRPMAGTGEQPKAEPKAEPKEEKDAPVAPKAIVVDEPKKATGKPMAGSMTPEALFAHTHGGPFDPKSSMDKKKMAAINSMLSKEGSGDLTPNQFALKIYRQK